MLKNVKIMMDESSRQSLEMIRSNFSELLAPIQQISDFPREFEDLKDLLSNLSRTLRRDIADAVESLPLKQIQSSLKTIEKNQEKIFLELEQISERANNFIAAFSDVNWDDPTL